LRAAVAAATAKPLPKKLSNVEAFVAPGPGGAAAVPAPIPETVQAPIQLTGSDGTGLVLKSLDARAVVDGPVAFTELRLRFHNPENRRREGRFAITLPSGAGISRFAMKINGEWMEGEVVEKQRARRIYEDFLHRKQDPAILEQDAGNTFRARVFPIEAKADKELIVSWSQELTDAASAYTLPLTGLPTLDDLSISAFVHDGDGETVEVRKTDYQPTTDFEVYPQFLKSEHDGLRSGSVAMARVRVDTTAPAAPFDTVAVLFDTSASAAIGFDGKVKELFKLVRFLDRAGATEVVVLAFDQDTAEIYRGAPSGFSSAHTRALQKRGALGASDVASALTAAGKMLSGPSRVILFTDGVATAGARGPDALGEAATKLAVAGVQRIDTVTTTSARDDGALATLVTSDLPAHGVAITLGDNAGFGPLALATFKPIKVEVPGAKWVWPDTVRGLQAGRSVVVYADLAEDKPFEVHLSGGATATNKPNTRTAPGPLVERAWMAARIKLLEKRTSEGDPDLRQAFKTQAIKLSIAHRVLSPWTALLVLETENDYRRYAIDRKALADVLTVSDQGVAVRSPRADTFAHIERKPREPNVEGLKTLMPRKGLSEKAADEDRTGSFARGKEDERDPRSGFDFDEAPSAAAGQPMAEPEPVAAAPPPAVAMKPRARRAPKRAPTPTTPGQAAQATCDSAKVDRVMRRHARAVQACFQSHVAPNPTLASRVTLRFTIGADGKVSQARPVRANAMDAGVTACLLRVVKAIRFPRSATSCTAVLPLVFTPGSRAPGPRNDAPPRPEDRQGAKEFKAIQASAAGKPPHSGDFAEIQTALDGGKAKAALEQAWAWRLKHPTEVLAVVALGRALQATGETSQAARAYGSIIDLYPSRADLRRFAGNLLEETHQMDLATDTYRAAMEQRPDHPAVYHMLAMALVAGNKHLEALDVLAKGIKARRRTGNFPAVERILREDMAIIAGAHLARKPGQRGEVDARLHALGVQPTDGVGLRFVLTWETDANDVDFHIFDAQKRHAYYSSKRLRGGGGELYADVTRGYGPECFAIHRPKAHPYRLFAHYYSRGPMGYGMGRVQVIRHDGDGGIDVEHRPFVIMNDQAWVDLGQVAALD